MKHIDEYRDPKISRKFAEKIRAVGTRPIRLMEVCGTHTVAIFRNGIRSLLPDTVTLLSGPGCPVCVTAQGEIDAFVELAEKEDVIVATFGDLMRVPGRNSSLGEQRSDGRDVRVVYSAFDALEIARKNPDKQVVVPGIGFETTAPTIAASILSAREMKLPNFSVFSAHKLVPPALIALMDTDDFRVDGFLLPGHVSVIIGVEAYRDFFDRYRIPCVVAGFEPGDILRGIYQLVSGVMAGDAKLENAYPRAVTAEGNTKAKTVMASVFEPADATWRGIGVISESGLKIRDEFSDFDAGKRFDVVLRDVPEPKGCECGQILRGLKTPPECPLYKTACTPSKPVGPCMVSTEGTCAAYFKYEI